MNIKLLFFFFLMPVQMFSMDAPAPVSDIQLNFDSAIYGRLFNEVSEVVDAGREGMAENNGAFQIYRDFYTHLILEGVEGFMNSFYAPIRQLARPIGALLETNERFTRLLIMLSEAAEERRVKILSEIQRYATELIARDLSNTIGIVDPNYSGTTNNDERNRRWLEANAHLDVQSHYTYLIAATLIRYYLLQVLQAHAVNLN